MKKKSFGTIFVACLMLFSACFITVSSAFADDFDSTQRSDGVTTCADDSFLGFVPWDCGIQLKKIEGPDKISQAIWTVAANVAKDLTTAAAYLILGYIIYGGYLYIFNSSDPSKVMAGKKTLSQAFIGFAIVMAASIIVSTVWIALNPATHNLQDCITSTGGTVFSSECAKDAGQVSSMITSAIQWIVGITGAVALIFVVYGAIMYITSGGDVGKIQKAKNIIMYSLIGLVIVALAEVITAFVSQQVRDATKSSYLNNTSIAITLNEKEFHEIHQIT